MNKSICLGIKELFDDYYWVQDPDGVYRWIPMPENGYSVYAPFDEARAEWEELMDLSNAMASAISSGIKKDMISSMQEYYRWMGINNTEAE